MCDSRENFFVRVVDDLCFGGCETSWDLNSVCDVNAPDLCDSAMFSPDMDMSTLINTEPEVLRSAETLAMMRQRDSMLSFDFRCPEVLEPGFTISSDFLMTRFQGLAIVDEIHTPQCFYPSYMLDRPRLNNPFDPIAGRWSPEPPKDPLDIAGVWIPAPLVPSELIDQWVQQNMSKKNKLD